MKKVINIIILLLVIGFVCTLGACKKDDLPKIGIVQYVTHASLDTIRDETIKALKDEGYEDGKNCKIILENGNGQSSTISSIMSSLSAKDVDVIVAIATPTAAEAVKYNEKIYGYVTGRHSGILHFGLRRKRSERRYDDDSGDDV